MEVKNLEQSAVDDEDDFHEFESAPSSMSNLTPQPTAAANQNAKDDGDDYFQAFATFDPTPGSSSVATSSTQHPNEAPKASTTSDTGSVGGYETAAEEEGDNFGEFDLPAPVPTDRTGAAFISVDSKPMEESFGDFNEPVSGADLKSATRTAVISPSVHIDEDFGDFSDFDSAPAAEVSPPQGQSNTDFDGTTGKGAAQKQDQNEGEVTFDDDFGDFDSAPAIEVNAPPLNQTRADSAMESRSQLYSSTSGTSYALRTLSHPEKSAEAQDPVLQKAKNVFSKVFEKYKLDVPVEEPSASINTITVAELMASIDGAQDDRTSQNLDDDFWAILNELQKEESPPVFVAADGDRYSSNAHFSVPVEFSAWNSNDRMYRQQVAQSQVGTDSSRPPPSAWPQKRATKLQPGPLTKVTSSTLTQDHSVVEKMSEITKRLLLQIPDLSFMLQSELCLPSKVK